MPISGLVVTLVEDVVLQEGALNAMRAHPAIELGERSLHQIPVVVESTGEEEDRLVWEWLHALPGVAMVVVAFIHFDDDAELNSTTGAYDDTSLPSLERKS